MRALQFSEYSGPEVLRWEEAPLPHAGPGEIRISVRAASVNPIDWKILSGAMSGGQPLAGTGYLGFDAAGVVDEVGEGVSGVSVGDEVFGRGQNTQAENAVRPKYQRTVAGFDVSSAPMKQSVSLITLGVADYERSKAFYEAIGWSPALDIEETAFFEANGVVLVLWSRDRLAADMGVADDGARWSGVALAHNVASEEEVASVIEDAGGNGAEIIREPAPTFYGGYAGGFRDPDGHVWEVAYNPGFGLTDDGSVILPEH